ncbi:MAG: polysaccharide deacetylase family protein [Candidatus Omnitrophica bacterium]|nr:polysaccharide deacetylase family protein [Candidatus Omnitrophota bacterium]
MRPYYTIPILMYHNIDEQSRFSKLSVSPKSFEKQVAFIRKKDIDIISLQELIRCEHNRRSKKVCITFDDGFENNFLNASPILQKGNIRATIFVSTDHIGRKGYLSWEQLKDIAKSSNIMVGSHTKSHRWLPGMKTDELRREIIDSKKILEDRLGMPIEVLSYPLGGINPEVIAIAKEAGYVCACSTNPPKEYDETDPFTLRRIKITRTSDNLMLFSFKVSGYYNVLR